MYSPHHEEKSVVAERFIKTLKNKIYKHMTSISKNIYFDVLANIVKQYNNTYNILSKIIIFDIYWLHFNSTILLK